MIKDFELYELLNGLSDFIDFEKIPPPIAEKLDLVLKKNTLHFITKQSMTNQHSLTPPSELVKQWFGEFFGCADSGALSPSERFLATRAAQWGADQELEACCEVLARELICDGKHVATDLHMIRRPKPPSLKEQALEELENMIKAAKDFGFGGTDPTAIRQVLEALPND
jgi:hypothetical protein